MHALPFAFASVLLTAPHEYHIDCNGWQGGATVEFIFRARAVDGNNHDVTITLYPRSDAEVARDQIWVGLERSGWRGREVGKGILVLEGYKKSPVKWVEFTSKGWKPDVRYVLKPPPEK